MKNTGKKQDSLDLHKKCLHIRESTLGRMHKDVAMAMNSLAVRSHAARSGFRFDTQDHIQPYGVSVCPSLSTTRVVLCSWCNRPWGFAKRR